MVEYELSSEELNIKLKEICSNEELDNEAKLKEMRKIIEDSGRSCGWAYNKARMLIDEEYKHNVYESLKKGWKKYYHNNPEFRAKFIKHITDYSRERYRNNEVYREKSKEYSRMKYNTNEEYKAKRQEQNREAYYKKHPEAIDRERKSEKIITEDGKVKYILSEEQKERKREANRLRYLRNKQMKAEIEVEEGV